MSYIQWTVGSKVYNSSNFIKVIIKVKWDKAEMFYPYICVVYGSSINTFYSLVVNAYQMYNMCKSLIFVSPSFSPSIFLFIYHMFSICKTCSSLESQNVHLRQCWGPQESSYVVDHLWYWVCVCVFRQQTLNTSNEVLTRL